MNTSSHSEILLFNEEIDDKNIPLINNNHNSIDNKIVSTSFYYNYIFISLLIALNQGSVTTCLYYSNMQLSDNLG